MVIAGAASSGVLRADESAGELGIAGYAKVGRWLPVTIRVPDSTADLFAISVDPEGRTVRFRLARDTANADGVADDSVTYRGLCKIGRIDGTLRIRTATGGDLEGETTGELKPLLKQSSFLVATLGKPAGFANLAEATVAQKARTKSSTKDDGIYVAELNSADELPTETAGYDALDLLVISGKYTLDDRRSRALQQWIREGGHLIYCRGSDLDAFVNPESPSNKTAAEHISRWLPVSITGQSRLRDLGEVEAYASQKRAIIFSGRVKAARIFDPGQNPYGGGTVLVRGSDGPLLVRVAFGLGRVTFCGLDFHRPPLSNWREVNTVAQRIVREAHGEVASFKRGVTNHQIVKSGLTDLGTQLNSIQHNFPDVLLVSSRQTMGWLFLYVLMIGPIDYLLVHKVLKRPRLTWVTFPAMVIGASLLALRDTDSTGEPLVRLNQVEIIDIDASNPNEMRQPIRVNSWMTLLSPETQNYGLQVRAADVVNKFTKLAGAVDAVPANPLLSWIGINENIFGGMNRTSGATFDRMSYEIDPRASSLGNIPIRVRSTAAFLASSRSTATQVVESQLVGTRTGQLSGSFTHRLRLPITDWVLVYGSRMYVPVETGTDTADANAIPPGIAWAPTSANSVTSDLMRTLTGLRLTAEKREQGMGSREVSSQASYDPSAHDINQFVRVLSFHAAIGGKKYTGLDNRALAKLDFTRLIQLDRAVLIGRIATPAIHLMRQEGSNVTEIEPERRDTFVRIVLPVRQPKSVINRAALDQQPRPRTGSLVSK